MDKINKCWEFSILFLNLFISTQSKEERWLVNPLSRHCFLYVLFCNTFKIDKEKVSQERFWFRMAYA